MRAAYIRKYNPVLNEIDTDAPLTVGNGTAAFTADVTGTQSLSVMYEGGCPLHYMRAEAWETSRFEGGQEPYPRLDDLPFTEYTHDGRTVRYPTGYTEETEALYMWLRQNPHRVYEPEVWLELDGSRVRAEQITGIRQELDLYTGVLVSRFELAGIYTEIITAMSDAGDVSVRIARFGTLNEGSCAAGQVTEAGAAGTAGQVTEAGATGTAGQKNAGSCTDGTVHILSVVGARADISAEEESAARWEHFWESVKLPGLFREQDRGNAASGAGISSRRVSDITTLHMMDSNGSEEELRRRTILSMYLIAAQELGHLPPQETGLTVNSWHGKFHLEMHPIHLVWLAAYGRADLLEPSLEWYIEHLPEARMNAARNGYCGARWPKQTGPDAIDSPSPVSPLLIWQQPHIIYMLRTVLDTMDDGQQRRAYIEKYREVIEATAEFMADFLTYDEQTGLYGLTAPLIPVQECYDPVTVYNPAFELEYWAWGLKAAAGLCEEYDAGTAARDGVECGGAPAGAGTAAQAAAWREMAAHIVSPAADTMIWAHANCPDPYSLFNRDHPSFLYGPAWLGWMEDYELPLDREIYRRSLEKVLKCWDYDSLWGWDFAMLALTAEYLGEHEMAVEILLKAAPKNTFLLNGHNMQANKNGLPVELPVYLPGNGALLPAVRRMFGN